MMDSSTDPNLGQILINRYRLAELIGQGSMGKVYRAEDQLLGGVTVAVKFLAQTLLSEKMKMRFAHEARTGAQLGQRSLHIVRVLDYGVHRNEAPFYVMEYMEGRNLSDLIAFKPLEISQFLRLMRHICLGLECAHQGIKIDGQHCQVIHRDIKPSNAFVISDPSLGSLAKVLDFGIAQFLSDSTESNQTGSFMGTLAYCSPEQIAGQDLDSRSDIYSLGITMFEVLTGHIPIQASTNSIGSWYHAHRSQAPKTLAQVAPALSLPDALNELIMACMAKSPGDRPQTMAEILSILQSLLAKDLDDGRSPMGEPVIQEQRKTDQSTMSDRVRTSEAARVPSIPNPQQRFWSIEDAGWNVSWPATKPIADIVFPQFLQTEKEEAVALWVMLPRSEVSQRLLNTRYNQFLCTIHPHPMVLWITTIYDPLSGPKWLPCYLDLKDARGEKAVKLLSQKGYYPLIFFAREDPEQPANVCTVPIAPYQKQIFQDWLRISRGAVVPGSAMTSKQMLKAELEKIKPNILIKLENAQGQKFKD
ncbi:serine/threonine-protein kinase [Acaryochloris sp. IP29b_bin.148]|uniref:serine/threonine protein kinase n=1 Tax=Acaryochloris sp. IP29b_bin.148 TaxID=2969218 RepID=UPI00261A1AB5|nr:serine/threonine-protein kinase [Acaryochloris sp. IP29b_bin.148]